MDFLLPLGAAVAAITKYLSGWLNKWSAGFPPGAADVAEAHSNDPWASASLLYTDKIIWLELEQAKVTQTGRLGKNDS